MKKSTFPFFLSPISLLQCEAKIFYQKPQGFIKIDKITAASLLNIDRKATLNNAWIILKSAQVEKDYLNLAEDTWNLILKDYADFGGQSSFDYEKKIDGKNISISKITFGKMLFKLTAKPNHKKWLMESKKGFCPTPEKGYVCMWWQELEGEVPTRFLVFFVYRLYATFFWRGALYFNTSIEKMIPLPPSVIEYIKVDMAHLMNSDKFFLDYSDFFPRRNNNHTVQWEANRSCDMISSKHISIDEKIPRRISAAYTSAESDQHPVHNFFLESCP